ncbi:MAG: TetR/AcrR family transcriptional regulator [Solirubrobacteraceae bacterium]|nr:TetR/AcrR family transcriptional regulator [Solirubrobacteraceae bacterium]
MSYGVSDLQPEFLRTLRGDEGPLPPGPQARPREEVGEVHRRRLIAGMAEATAKRGIGATTIADVVRCAQVSRRTFYEHFPDKQACLLATYDASSEVVMNGVEAAFAQRVGQTWDERLVSGVRAYLGMLAAIPDLTRVFILDMPSAGPEALLRMRASHERFATLILKIVDEHRDDFPPAVGMEPIMATAVVGGINEMLLQALSADEPIDGPALELAAVKLLLGAMWPVEDLPYG